MNINPLGNSANFHQIGSKPQTNATRQGGFDRVATDRLSADRSSSIRSALAEIPEIRPDVVERGRQLLADPNYPSSTVVNHIARLITPLSED